MDTQAEDRAAVESTIHTAADQLRCVTFIYDGEIRLVEPYSFRAKKGRVLFYGFDHVRQAIRSFALNKITCIDVSIVGFTPRWPVELGSREDKGGEQDAQGLCL